MLDDFPQECADEFAANMVFALGEEDALRQFALMSGYTDVPPMIDTFIDDDRFMGKVLGRNIYPFLRQELRAIYPNPFYSPYSEIVLAGSVGWGKSNLALAIQAYDLCKLLYVEKPHQKFQIIPSQEIVIAFFNCTLRLAQAVLYNQFKFWLTVSPFFREQRGKCANPYREFLPNKLGMIQASRASHVLGTACVIGDTVVDLLDGTTPTMKELVESGKDDFWVLAYDVSDNSWKPSKAHSPRMTREMAEVYRVTLDNGESFIATADHPVLTRDNKWMAVQDLVVGLSLKSYKRLRDEKGYDSVWCHDLQKQVKLHKVV